MEMYWEVRERVQRKVENTFTSSFGKSMERQGLRQSWPRERMLALSTHRNTNHKIKSRPEIRLCGWISEAAFQRCYTEKNPYNLNWR